MHLGGVDGLRQASDEQVAELGPGPRFGDEKIVRRGDRPQARREVADEGVGVGAMLAVLRAIACTTASRFFDRWVSSRMTSRMCCSSGGAR